MLDILPTELLMYISNFLNCQEISRLRSVCRDFNEIYKSETVWKMVTVRYNYPRLSEKFISVDEYFKTESFYRFMRHNYLDRRGLARFKITSKTIKGNIITINSCKPVKYGEAFDFSIPGYKNNDERYCYSSCYCLWDHKGKERRDCNYFFRNVKEEIKRDVENYEKNPRVRLWNTCFVEEILENLERFLNLSQNSFLILKHGILGNYKLMEEEMSSPMLEFK